MVEQVKSSGSSQCSCLIGWRLQVRRYRIVFYYNDFRDKLRHAIYRMGNKNQAKVLLLDQ